jgi:hypothetical protein
MRRTMLAALAITATATALASCSSSPGPKTVAAPTPTAAAPSTPKPAATPVVDLSCGHPDDTADKAVPLGPNHVLLTPGASVAGTHVKITAGAVEKPFGVTNPYTKDDLDKAHKHAVAVHLDVTNTSTEPFHLDRKTFLAVDQDLNCYNGRNGIGLLGADDPRFTSDDPLQGNIGAGKTVKTVLAFEVPDDTTRLTLYVVGATGSDADPHPFIGGTMAL